MVLIIILLIASTVLNATLFKRVLDNENDIRKKDNPMHVTDESLLTYACARTMSAKCILLDSNGEVLEDSIKNLERDIELIKEHIGIQK
jgi:hypothetical protein